SHRAGDGQYRPGPPPAAPMEVSAELLGQSDDDALRATQEAEPVDVLVLRDLADQFGTVAAQAGNDVVDVVDSEHDAAYAQRVRRRACRLGSDRRRRVELRQLDPAVAVRGRDALRGVLGMVRGYVGIGRAVNEQRGRSDVVELEITDLRELLTVVVEARLATRDRARYRKHELSLGLVVPDVLAQLLGL